MFFQEFFEDYNYRIVIVLQRLYLMFLVVKLITTLVDPITKKHSSLPLDLIIINVEKECEIEIFLDSYWYYKRY